jgi:hypothetical protein
VISQPYSPDKERFGGDVVLAPQIQKVLDPEAFLTQLGKAAQWHEKFSRSQVAEGLELPLVLGHFLSANTMADLLGAVRKQRVRDLVSYRVAKPTARSRRIVLDSEAWAADRNRPSIVHVMLRNRLDLKKVGKNEWIEGWALPPRVERR